MLRFVEGSLKGQKIDLDPEEMPIVFGKDDENQEVGQKKGIRTLTGNRICSHHFEIDYDKVGGGIMLRNLNFDSKKSCGVHKMLNTTECHNLQPGDAFRIGTLEFVVERFNTGIVSDIG